MIHFDILIYSHRAYQMWFLDIKIGLILCFNEEKLHSHLQFYLSKSISIKVKLSLKCQLWRSQDQYLPLCLRKLELTWRSWSPWLSLAVRKSICIESWREEEIRGDSPLPWSEVPHSKGYSRLLQFALHRFDPRCLIRFKMVQRFRPEVRILAGTIGRAR